MRNLLSFLFLYSKMIYINNTIENHRTQVASLRHFDVTSDVIEKKKNVEITSVRHLDNLLHFPPVRKITRDINKNKKKRTKAQISFSD